MTVTLLIREVEFPPHHIANEILGVPEHQITSSSHTSKCLDQGFPSAYVNIRCVLAWYGGAYLQRQKDCCSFLVSLGYKPQSYLKGKEERMERGREGEERSEGGKKEGEKEGERTGLGETPQWIKCLLH